MAAARRRPDPPGALRALPTPDKGLDGTAVIPRVRGVDGGDAIARAAMIMVVAFGAFALAGTVTIKRLGVGMAISMLVDATVVRVLLVPATMWMPGEWDWRAPGILGRLADRLGFSHVEDADGDADVQTAPSNA